MEMVTRTFEQTDNSSVTEIPEACIVLPVEKLSSGKVEITAVPYQTKEKDRDFFGRKVLDKFISLPDEKLPTENGHVLSKRYLTEDKKLILANSDNRIISDFYKEHSSFHNQVLNFSGMQMFVIYEIMGFIDYLFTYYSEERNVDLIYVHRSIISILPAFTDFLRTHPEMTIWTDQIKAFEKETKRTNINIFLFAIKTYLKKIGLALQPSFMDDDWVIDELFNVSSDRRANGTRIDALHFGRIINEDSKKEIKCYIRFLMEGSTLSVDGEIPSLVRYLTEFSNFLGGTSVLSANREDCKNYIDNVCGQDVKQNSKSKKVYTVMNFYHFLLTVKKINEMPIKDKDCPKQAPYEHHDRSMPDSVFLQFMEHLDDLPHWALAIFLIQACSGPRIGDVISLKRGCLHQSGDNWYADIYISKTKNDTRILLSKEVHKIIEEYLAVTADSVFTDADYMFPAPRKRNWHISERYYSDEIKAFIVRNNICNSDGTLYRFQSHSLRHRQATKITETGLSIFYVAKALSHGHLEMSACYIDNREEHIKNMRGFIDSSGLPTPLVSFPKVIDGDFKTWLKKHGNAFMVQDGICDRSSRFGQCPLGQNTCITCEYYRTSPEFLPYHRERLAQLNELRVLAIERKSEISLAKIDREINLRKKFIVRLEQMVMVSQEA